MVHLWLLQLSYCSFVAIIYLAAGHSLTFPKTVSQEDDQKPENTCLGRVKTCFPPPKLQQPSHAGL